MASSSADTAPRPPLPPFTRESAHAKVKAAQDAWNTTNPEIVVPAYTKDCIWRNRGVFCQGHADMTTFLRRKWAREKNYRLRKELFAFTDERIAVQFWYEFQAAPIDNHAGAGDDGNTGDGHYRSDLVPGQWYRCYGLEDWTFAADGRMRKRMMSGNDVPITEAERWFRDGVDVNTVDISEKHW
ncbi:DUF1348 domain containing protein [Niveomyces insectorum RCEF 264]|uniref:DUF1348 domain containing protein n=1 Tax=Niveomyces insectorum RCEF 264 TaxID=1081102 RepID=A0A162K5M2_9HYPO|nr:DUF1348 domain containing protein [Niveomyces insectorum RCEF 264]